MSKPIEPDKLIEEVEELLAKTTPGPNGIDGNAAATLNWNARDYLRRLVEEVKRLRVASTDVMIQKLQIMQEKYPGQRIEVSVDPDGYCCVTRVDRDAMYHPIAEGATLGDVFEDRNHA